ncbi:MAG: sensor histidine kinase [Candidatus Hodarchaeales archaeon]
MIGTILLILLYLISQENYLLFHSSVEIFSVLVAWAIFIIAWNTEKYSEHRHIYYLGIAYLFVGGLDFVHTFAYEGMGVFPGYGANLATQLWILARFMESISLLLYPLMLHRQCPKVRVFSFYTIISTLSLSLIALDIFPTAFVVGEGLTLFKIISEYIIIAFLIAALINIREKRNGIESILEKNLSYALIVTIFAELAFTLYVSVYGFSNFVGHILKILSFYFIYRGIIVTSLEKPREYLIHTLEKSQKRIKDTNKFLRVINSILVHDLLNDLTNIRFSIELIEAEQEIDTLGIAKRATDKGINLITRMSDLETLIGQDKELRTASLKNMISEILINDVLYRDIKINIQGDCEPKIDNAMYSVLDNILRNAVLHSGTDKIDVKLEKNENKCSVQIKDYGKGIPDTIKEKIFETGYSSSGHEVSLGIGLSIVKNVMERYGGSVRVIDTLPSGATFILELYC